MTEYLVDLSHYDHDRHPSYSLAAMHAAGINGSTHKATEGTSYQDPDFANYAHQLPGSGMAVHGSYHAAHPGNAKAQADYWVSFVEKHYPNWRHDPCWLWQLDAEKWASDGGKVISLTDIRAMGSEVQRLTGCHPSQFVAYCPEWVYGDSLRGLGHPLWASNYGPNKTGDYRASYPGDKSSRWGSYSGITPTILQYDSQATVAGLHPFDVNGVRVSSVSALQRLFVPASPAPGFAAWFAPAGNTVDVLGNAANPSAHVHGGVPSDSAACKADIKAVKTKLYQLGYRGFDMTPAGITVWGDGTDAALLQYRDKYDPTAKGVKTLGRDGYTKLMKTVKR